MERKAVLGGYSANRLAIAGMALVPIGLFLWLSVIAARRKRQLSRIDKTVSDWLNVRDRHFYSVSVLSFIALVGLGAYALFELPFARPGDPLILIFSRMKSLIAWSVAIAVQAVVLLFVGYPAKATVGSYVSRQALLRASISAVSIILLLSHWAILYFRIELFSKLPNWYWQFFERGNMKLAPFFALLGVAVLMSALVRSRRYVKWKAALIAIILGYTLQLGFGLVEGGGIDALRHRYLDKGRSEYAQIVSDPDFSPGDAFYPERLAGSRQYFARTKPPGYLLFFWFFQQLVNPGYSSQSFEMNLAKLTTFMNYLFPLIALTVVPLAQKLGRTIEITDEETAQASLFYVAFPSVILFALQLDQVLFPLLFTVALYMIARALEKARATSYFVLGIVFSICFFFSFSLVPILAVAAIWFAIRMLPDRRRGGFVKRYLNFAGFMALGLLVSHILMKAVFRYDAVAHFADVISFHSSTKGRISTAGEYLATVGTNLAEFSIWLGFPFLILIGVRAYRVLRNLAGSNMTKADQMLASLFVAFALLLLFGNTKGEVARLWLFLLSPLALLVAQEVKKVWNLKPLIGALLMVAQVATTFLILKYQFPWQ